MKAKLVFATVLFSSLAWGQDLVPLAAGTEPITLLDTISNEFKGFNMQEIEGVIPGTPSAPTRLQDLPFESITHKLISRNLAIRLGYLSASAEYNDYNGVLVSTWKKYAKVNMTMEKDGKTINRIGHIGCSLQLEMKLKGVDAKISLGSLIRNLSASAKYEKYDVDISMHAIGFSSPKVTSALPSIDFLSNLKDLRAVSTSFKQVKDTVWSCQEGDTKGVRPQLIAIDVELVNK